MTTRTYLYLTIAAALLLAACTERVDNPVATGKLPDIYPDYLGVTIPDGIAPLNFDYNGDAELVDVVVRGSKGGELHVQGDYADFDVDEWHALTRQNRGGRLTVTVCTRQGGQWSQHKDFTIAVSPYALDEWGLTYRRVAPSYEVYSSMGLYQRDLGNFDETPIIENTLIPGQCVNCHASAQTDPSHFVFHIRGSHGATLIRNGGRPELLKAKNDLLGGSMVYPYWHPTKKYCAFSTNQTRQAFHVVPDERIEVFDLSSDVLIYNPTTREILTDSLLSTKDWSENCPVFSPDGRWLYYMTCLQQEYPANFRHEKYNLCRIAFDPDKGTFGSEVDTLFNAVAMNKSLTWPRPSYDGRYIMFTLLDYGYFSIWHRESDQWLLDLKSGQARPLDEVNSPDADSYHNWNVNSHWFVFTSRRENGLYSQLFLSSIDEQGRATKPFLLPQRHPREYYANTLYSFNTPDFTKSPVEFDDRAAASAILSDQRVETHVVGK